MDADEPFLVILTALELEYSAIRRHLADVREFTHPAGTVFEVGRLGGGSGAVAIAATGPGNRGAAVLAERAIAIFRPRALLFVGVAGALSRDLAIGDVVVATRVYSYEGGRSEDDGFLSRPRGWDAPHDLEQLARRVARTSSWTASLAAGVLPRVHFRPVAAGEVVLGSRRSSVAEHLRRTYNDAAAIEMESAGIAEAGHLNRTVPVLSIRGISDQADAGKRAADDAGSQPMAAAHAAAFAIALARAMRGTAAAEWVTTGNSRCERHGYREAEAAYRAAIALDEGLASAHAGLGYALHMRLRYAEAERAGREAIRISPGYALGHANLGRTLASLGRGTDAEAACLEAIGLDPDCAIAHTNLGRALGSLGRYQEATVACRRAISLAPALALARTDLGDLWYCQGRFTEAAAAYRDAVDVDGGFPFAHAYLARTLADLGRYADAEAACLVAIELAPDLALARSCLGDIWYRQDRYDAAEEQYQQAIELDPADGYPWEGLGHALYSQGRYPQAAAAFDAAIRLDPHGADAYVGVADAQYQQGLFAKAEAAYRAAAELSPDDSYASRQLTAVRRRLGQRHSGQ